MSDLQLILFSIPGVYFNAVLLTWFVETFRKNGLVFAPARGFKLMTPVFKAFLFGVVPGAVITNYLAFYTEKPHVYVSVPMVIGIVVSGIVLHRDLISHSENLPKTNAVIAGIGLALAVFWGFIAFISH
ncbi:MULTISPECIES: hypothetical protein [unclassified Ruegeria]|uniref:hypothetical protein n=1 Tax=unclassified Ruegeria TaxID=2625375 RepID=UPI0014876D97|nr:MULTISPECIES: hypothetical protein [unclassified Ruegeria]